MHFQSIWRIENASNSSSVIQLAQTGHISNRHLTYALIRKGADLGRLCLDCFCTSHNEANSLALNNDGQVFQNFKNKLLINDLWDVFILSN